MNRTIHRNLILTIITMIVMVILSCVIQHYFVNEINIASEKESLNHVEETGEQLNFNLQNAIEYTQEQLFLIQKSLSYTSLQNVDELMERLDYLKSTTNLDDIYLLSKDGVSINSNNEKKNWNFTSDMLSLLKENEPVCTISQNYTGEDRLMFAVPLDEFQLDGYYFSYLIGEYKPDDFLDAIEMQIYNGQGSIYVINKSGNIIFSTGKNENKSYLFFSRFKDTTFDYNDNITTAEELRQAILTGENGAVKVIENDYEYALAFSSIDIMDWALAVIVDYETMESNRIDFVTRMRNISLWTIIIVVIVGFLFYICTVTLMGRKSDMLVKNRERLVDIITSDTMGAYMLVDEETLICRYASTGVRNIIGIPPEYLVGKSLDETFKTIGKGKIPPLGESLKNWDKKGKLFGERFRFFNPYTENTLYLRSGCIVSDGGEMVVSYIDETESVKREDALKNAMEVAQTANRAKSDFLSNMSHDIRTPMNAIIGFVVLLSKNTENPEKVKEYAEKIYVSSQHLLSLLNDILDMSRIESGKISLSLSEFNIDSLLKEIDVVISPQAEIKKQVFEIKISELNQKEFFGDCLRLKQILINLLSNSVKYTDKGGKISLEVKDIPQKQDGYTSLNFVVKDNGMGMDESFVKHIFEPFAREANSTVSGIQGTGLGLAITKNLVDLMGGIIDVKTQKGLGSEFTLEFEFKNATAQTQTEKSKEFILFNPDTKKDEFFGLNFLVAEDNELNSEIVTEVLKMEGIHCDVVENGLKAVQKFQNSKIGEYNLILMDIQMPVMNGYEAVKNIRKLQRADAQTIPIVAMTANAFKEDIQNAFISGMNAHLPKPLDVETLKNCIRELLFIN